MENSKGIVISHEQVYSALLELKDMMTEVKIDLEVLKATKDQRIDQLEKRVDAIEQELNKDNEKETERLYNKNNSVSLVFISAGVGMGSSILTLFLNYMISKILQ